MNVEWLPKLLDRELLIRFVLLASGLWLALMLGLVLLLRKLVVSADRIQAPAHRLSEHESKYLKIEDQDVHYLQVGSGPHLVLLHGIGASVFVWRYLIEELSRSFTVTALDLPGFGKSGKDPAADYGLDAQEGRLLQFLDALGIQEARLVGSSMGGTLALWLTTRHPSRFTRVALLAPATDPTFVPRKLSRLLRRMPFIHKTLNRATINLILRMIFRKPELIARDTIEAYLAPYLDQEISVKTFLAAMDLLGDERLPEVFRECKNPVLVLYGAGDRMVFKNSLLRLQQLLPNCTLEIHPFAGHHVMEEDPQWALEKLTIFFGI